MVSDISEKPATFDANQEVPDEYDVFCEGCGYSLAGLGGERCPECGKIFDPSELPFARVPWLHRRRLGWLNAYIKTVFAVSFRPAPFARELCRPVRISAEDARKFRRLTIWLVTAMLIVILAAIPVLAIFTPMFGRGLWMIPASTYVFAGLVSVGVVVAAHFFLRLATDMPLFIWKGIAALPPSELAPIHHYACAPLAFFPLPMMVVAFLFYQMVFDGGSRVEDAFYRGTEICAIASPAWLWIVALILMRHSAEPGIGRLTVMALYLPIHWVLMLAMCFMALGVYVQCVHFAFSGANLL